MKAKISAVLLGSVLCFTVFFSSCGQTESLSTAEAAISDEVTAPEETYAAETQEQYHPDVIVEAQYIPMSFSEAVLRHNSAFIGTYISSERIRETGQLKAVFHIEEDLYGNLNTEEVSCLFLASGPYMSTGYKKLGYQVGNQYLIVANAKKAFFMKELYFFPADLAFLDVTNQVYQYDGEALPYESKEGLCSAILNVWKANNSTPEEIVIASDGTWESAQYIAEVELVLITNPSNPTFTGNCYQARIVRMIRGEEDALIKFGDGTIFLTLSAERTKVGKTYVAGFSLKNGADSVYTQEGTETVSLPDSIDVSLFVQDPAIP